MPDYTHPSLALHGHHVPEEHRTVNTDGTVEVVQLPGVFQIWAEVGGQHKQIMEFKAGKLISKIEAAKSESGNSTPSQ